MIVQKLLVHKMDPTDRNNFIELLNGADQLKWAAYSSHDIKRFSRNEVEKVTGNYKTTVGQGALEKFTRGPSRTEVRLQSRYLTTTTAR